MITETPPPQAVENVFQAVQKIFQGIHTCRQHTYTLRVFYLEHVQEVALCNNGVNLSTDIASKLNEAILLIQQNVKDSMQYLLMAQGTIGKTIECTYKMLNKFLDENRFSIYDPEFDDSDAVVPQPPQPLSTASENMEYQLAKKFELTTSYIFDLWKAVGEFFQQLLELKSANIINEQDVKAHIQPLKAILEQLKITLQDVLLKSIVITKQPPLVALRHGAAGATEETSSKKDKCTPSKPIVQCQTTFDLELKVLTSNYLSRFCGPEVFSNVKPLLVTDDNANQLLSHKLKSFPKSSGNLKTADAQFKSSVLNDITLWAATFYRVKVTSVERADKLLEDTRYCVLFAFNNLQPLVRLKTPLDEAEFSISFNNVFVSLPFAVIVHPTVQKPNVLPGIFWYRAFAPLNCINSDFGKSFPSIPWNVFKRRLNQLFFIATGARKLCEDQLHHLGCRLFNKDGGFESEDVTFNLFCKDKVPDTEDESNPNGFTFFDWLYFILNWTGNKKNKPYYDGGLIVGFMSRQNATRLISSYNEPTMLVKFSDNMKGTLVFCIYLPHCEEKIVFLGLDEKVIKDMSLYDCYEKLWQSHPYLNAVKRMQCGYNVGDIKSVDNLIRINQESESKSAAPVTDHRFSKKSPYKKAEWKLCMDDPQLKTFLHNGQDDSIVPQFPPMNYVTLQAPASFASSPSPNFNDYSKSVSPMGMFTNEVSSFDSVSSFASQISYASFISDPLCNPYENQQVFMEGCDDTLLTRF